MFRSIRGTRGDRNCRSVHAIAALGLLAFGLAGCSSTQSAYSAADAAVAQRVERVASVEIEDDGLPAQAAPPARIRFTPDDPSEPFSPNYGGANPIPVRAPVDEADEAATPPTLHIPRSQPTTVGFTIDRGSPQGVPADLPPAFRQKLVSAMTNNE